MTGGTTRCPHCDTRFRISAEQLAAYHGMVRCGRCRQAFDAQFSFVPEYSNVQQAAEDAAITLEQADEPLVEQAAAGVEAVAVDACVAENAMAADAPDHFLNIEAPGIGQEVRPEERITVMPDSFVPPSRFGWLWVTASLLLLVALLAQAAYLFRVELAARLPGLRPALESYCQLLSCTVPLPQKINLIDIESSALEADPANESNITLNATLRNSAPHVQAFPLLELTLNDSQDKPLARRTFRPADYLPPGESEAAGLRPNRELVIRLHLDINSLKPMGYRLALFYPQ